jgi:hypothetical protein
MMSRQSYDQKNNRQINREETKAQDDLLLFMMHSPLPLLQAQATLQHQQQSQLLRQQFLQSALNPLLNLQTSLSLAAALNPSLVMASSHFQLGIPSMSLGTLASAETLLGQLPQTAGRIHELRNSIQMMQQSGHRTSLPQALRLQATAFEAAIPNTQQEGDKEVDEKGKRDPVHAFPTRLHDILSTKEYNDYVAWLPHGRAWRILNKSQFEKKVIPHHFRHARYASFMRQASCFYTLCAYYVIFGAQPPQVSNTTSH